MKSSGAKTGDGSAPGFEMPAEEQRLWLEREILERKRMEQALHESEERLRLAVRTAPITLFTQDASLHYTWVFNPPPGLRLEEILGRTDDEIFGDEGIPLTQFKRRVLQTGVGAREEVVVTVGGSRRWFNITVEPMRDRAETIIGLICAAVDVSALKQSQNALAESEARYRAIVESFDGLVYICSDDYRVEFMNQKLIERTGRCAIGEKCHQVLHGLDHICPWCQNDRVLKGEKVRWEVQSPLDGRWYYVVNTPIPRADGRVSKMAAILDITERKEAERRQSDMTETVQRSHHLESMARLTGNIAHHFNNQLTVILGNCELASGYEATAGELRICLDEIRRAAERAGRLSNEMLTCSGHAFSTLRPGRLNDVVESSRALLEVVAAPRVRLNFLLAHPSPRVRMDSRLLQQVLLNLVTNSVEAIGENSGEVWVETGHLDITEVDASQLHPPCIARVAPMPICGFAIRAVDLIPNWRAACSIRFPAPRVSGAGWAWLFRWASR